MILALSDSAESILAVVGPIVGTILTIATPFIIMWLKKQSWVKKAHLENFFQTMVPQVVQWVDSWDEDLVKEGGDKAKPTPQQKDAKFKQLLKAQLPAKASITDEELALRAKAELKALKEAAAWAATKP
jgi:hypothetical protein